MQLLNEQAMLSVSGGHNKNEYNFTFIVQNTVTLGCVGIFMGCPALMAGVGAAYATAMLATQTLDNYAFPCNTTIDNKYTSMPIEAGANITASAAA